MRRHKLSFFRKRVKAMNEYGTRPLWFWNARPTEDGIIEITENCVKKDGFAGFGVLPYGASGLKYMSDEYLDLYGTVLKQAKRLGVKICLYDEWWFPSGGAGGIMKEKYPSSCAKRLDLETFRADGRYFDITLPNEKIMALVAMKGDARIDVSDKADGNRLTWTAPDDGFSVLCFVLRDADTGRVDYLDPDAVKDFISCTHNVYYERFSEYFGSVIDSAFYDEPQFYSAKGRAWTSNFNEKFTEKYGVSPALYYPALFFDIGDETAQARNMMIGFRAELYANGFPRVIGEWCNAHGISLTGHVDQEEAENPCGITGDLMMSFKYQDIPGIDEIFAEGRASDAYKIVSSAATNTGKRLVMCECFGANERVDERMLYRETYDMLTKGVNLLVPHAVWYDPTEEKVKFKPELSYRNGYFGKILPDYNKFCAVLQKKLQNSGAVNTVGILYPIESLRYVYFFDPNADPVLGGPTFDNNNYMKLGQYLSREMNCDFTFVHPDVLNENCTINDGKIVIGGAVHYQSIRVMILPGMKAMSVKTAELLERFVSGGGTLISVSELPKISVESGKGERLLSILMSLFGNIDDESKAYEREHGSGKCVFLPYSKRGALANILHGAAVDTDVMTKTSGLQYIHKRSSDGDLWYFASIFGAADTDVVLNGRFTLTMTDPKTGEKSEVAAYHRGNSTVFHLKLDKERSVLIEEI